MPRNPIKPLNDKGRRICELYAIHGYTKADAYRIGGRLIMPRDSGARKAKMKDTANRASEFFQNPLVIEQCHNLLDAARAEDCLRVGRAVRQLEDAVQAAIDAENWTAASQLIDKKLKVMGLMRERVIIVPEEALSDEALVEQLADGDPKKAAMLRRIVGRDKFDKESLD